MAGTRYVTRNLIAERAAVWLSALSPWSRNRPLPPLTRSAIAVLDLQQYFADPQNHAFLPALEAVQENILNLVRAFRAAGRPVIFTRHGSLPDQRGQMGRWWNDELRRGEPRAALIPALEHLEPDLLLDKAHYSALRETLLLEWLKERRCDTLVICGVMTHLCCETTARDAFMCGLAPVVVADGCASLDEELHLGALRGLAHGFAVVSATAQVSNALHPAPEMTGEMKQAAGPPELEAVQGERPSPPRVTPQAVPAPELVVVGGGPAGLSAAVQARRSGLRVLVIEGRRLGGQARAAECIENYLGFPGGISGEALMDRFRSQARALGLEPLEDRVQRVTPGTAGLTLELERSPELTARAVVLATGAAPLALPEVLGPGLISSLEELPTLRRTHLLIIGGGEAAFDQALLAHRRGARQVTIALRGERPGALPLLVQRARERQIQVIPRATLQQVTAELAPSADLRSPPSADLRSPPFMALLRLALEGEQPKNLTLPVDGVLVCIGKKSVLPHLPAGLERTASGAPRTDDLGRTSLAGLYIAGDARRGPYRQVSIAAGDGVASAMHAARYLSTGVWKE